MSVLYVASESYKQADHFAYADRIIAVSHAMAKKAASVMQLPTLVLRPFMNKAAITCATRAPEYITLLNPLPAKGLMLAAALARECARRQRPYKFLFVEGRGTRETMTDIDEHGIGAVARQALNHLSQFDTIHISLDMDSLDPEIAPGVGTPVPGGLTYREAHLLMEIFASSHKVQSMDIVEINPILDNRNRTAELAVELAASLLGQRII
jgi:hypothetical protein